MRTLLLTTLAMLAFAGNSLLCRAALRDSGIDPASFTSLRIASGALVLCAIVWLRAPRQPLPGNWVSATALFVYAAGFSFAYVRLPAGSGALLLFGAVQVSMIAWGYWRGERLRGLQLAGLLLAMAGLVVLLLPGLAAPPPLEAALMLSAGVAWGVYSVRGRGAGDPTAVTAGNFVRALPFALAVSLAAAPQFRLDSLGAAYAIASGAIASGIGYSLWYTALRGLKATSAATAQLSVPAIAAAGGVLLLGEPLTLRLVLSSLTILGGIAIVLFAGRQGVVVAPAATDRPGAPT